jgi:hypothetical protein
MARMPDGKLVSMIRFDQAEWITFIYGVGVAAVYAVLALLYAHAHRLRGELHLNSLEAFETRERIIGNLLWCGLVDGAKQGVCNALKLSHFTAVKLSHPALERRTPLDHGGSGRRPDRTRCRVDG